MKRFFWIIALLCLATACNKNTTPQGSYTSAIYKGSLTSTNIEDNTSFEIKSFDIEVIIPNSLVEKLDLVFANLKFVDGGGAITPIFQDIAFKRTISEDQTSLNFIFSAEEVVPVINGEKNAENTIKNLTGCISKSEILIEFTMANKPYKVKFSAKDKFAL